MDSFLSFLGSNNSHPLSTEEDFDTFSEDVDVIITVWLREYIRIYDPGYTAEEAMKNIISINVTDDSIAFTFINPYSHIIEEMIFKIQTFQEIINETKYLTKEMLKKNSFSSFFDTDLSRRSDDCEEYERINIELSGLILIWLEKYISSNNLSYTLEDVRNSIHKVELYDNRIGFYIKHPHTGEDIYLSFRDDFLEELRGMASGIIENIILGSKNPKYLKK
ncbi:hypothetical protein AUK10_02135 [Candidatus Gracilibacteria bacterium CG2_30_37_12]|nr:MAG: hypothetical protein AUK10_02135 [Candidatus Gracilibacteria bacterium CG2_30_37_12]